jgi:hypothetical protein
MPLPTSEKFKATLCKLREDHPTAYNEDLIGRALNKCEYNEELFLSMVTWVCETARDRGKAEAAMNAILKHKETWDHPGQLLEYVMDVVEAASLKPNELQ